MDGPSTEAQRCFEASRAHHARRHPLAGHRAATGAGFLEPAVGDAVKATFALRATDLESLDPVADAGRLNQEVRRDSVTMSGRLKRCC